MRRCHHSSVECEILEARSEFRPCPCPGAAPSPWPGSPGGREPASGLTVAAALTLHPSVPRPSQSLQPRGRLQPKQVAPHSRCSAPGLPVAAAPQALTVAAAPHPPGPHSRCSAQVPLTVAAPKPSPSLSLTVARPSQSLQRPRPSLLIQEDG